MRSKAVKRMIAGLSFVLAGVVVIGGGLGFVLTPHRKNAPAQPLEGIKPFSSQADIRCNYYRIPSMLSTKQGTVVAAIDARFGGTADSNNNIDTAVSYSTDSGASWSQPTLPFYFNDFRDDNAFNIENGRIKTAKSASFIDPSLLEDRTVNENGRVFALVNAFPYQTGAPNGQVGNGYTSINGEMCLRLAKKGSADYNYTLRQDGFIYNQAGKKTEYSVNANFELLQNGQSLYVKQKKNMFWYHLSFGVPTKEKAAMNVMYEDALFRTFPTNYLYLKYSDDQGKTWSEPMNLTPSVKPDNVSFLGVCPGRGTQLTKGTFKDRLIFPVYEIDWGKSTQAFSTIYSDDHGVTWQKGETVDLDEEVGNMSETQFIEYPDGSLQAFARTQEHGSVGTAYSDDGGVTWKNISKEAKLPLTKGSGCQISAINYEGTIEGQPAVLLSAPAGDSRTNGFIYVGFIRPSVTDAQPYTIDWKYKKEITAPGTYFAYSCLTQLPNGSIGLLYEQANTPQSVDTTLFKSYTVDELTNDLI